MTVLIIVDALRWDIASDPSICPNLNSFEVLKPIWVNANQTEPSLMTILTGKNPLDHGIIGLGQVGAEETVRSQLDEDWKMFSPAILFREGIKDFQQGHYYTEIDDLGLDYPVSVLHIMGVHDYEHRGEWERFYEGEKPLPDESNRTKIDMTGKYGWIRPWEGEVKETPCGRARVYTDITDAGKLEAFYKAAAHRVDRWIGKVKEKCEEEGRKLIVTADHGECWGEEDPLPQPVFRHQGLFDEVLRVPLAVNRKYLNFPELADHTNVKRIIEGKELKEKEKIISCENTWQSGLRITTKGSYLIHYWNRVYDYPSWIGDENLKEQLLEEKEKFPDRKPAKMFKLERRGEM